MQYNIWGLINPQIAFRVTRSKYIGMIAPDLKLKYIIKILIFQEDKKMIDIYAYSADKIHNNHVSIWN